MQNSIKYIRSLTNELSSYRDPTSITIQRTYEFIHDLEDLPLVKAAVVYQPYYMPHGKAFTGTEYYLLLNNISRMIHVKMMWRWILREEDGMAVKGLWIIGPSDRISIAHAYMTWFFNSYWTYHQNICTNAQEEAKRGGYGNVRSYASKLTAIYMHTINNAIHSTLEEYRLYDTWLTNMIQEMFRLDYKDYEGKHEYYHAISTKFYHRRMTS